MRDFSYLRVCVFRILYTSAYRGKTENNNNEWNDNPESVNVEQNGQETQEENLPEFRRRFEEYVSKHLVEEDFVPELEVDMKINFRDITPKFMRILNQFAPFGPGNMAPIFWTSNVYDAGGSRPVGGHKHLKLTVNQVGDQELGVAPFSGIAFQKGDYFDRIHDGEPFSICYHLEYNTWQGKTTLQLNVKDIKFDNESWHTINIKDARL